MYDEDVCAKQAANSILSQNAQRMQGVALGNAGQQETELSSLLTTLRQQAFELRGITASILQRVSPQLPDETSEKQCFNGGYVGQAEEARSTLSETIRLLCALSKLV